MIDEAHKLRRDEPGSAPDRPAREGNAAEPLRAPAASVSPFGVDADILRRAAALPGFATFRPIAHRPPPAAVTPAEGPGPEDMAQPEGIAQPEGMAQPEAAFPVETLEETGPESVAGTAIPAEPERPDEPERGPQGPAQAVVFADADMVPPRRLDLTSIDRSLQRIADVLERRLGEIAERPHRLRDLGVAPRVPVPAAPEPPPAAAEPDVEAEPPEATTAEVEDRAVDTAAAPDSRADDAAAGQTVPADPAPRRQALGWGWAFLVGLAIFGGLVGAALQGWLPEPAGRLAAALSEALADGLARWR